MPVAQGLSPDIVIVGLSLSSSWGNGHATTYRSLVKGLSALGWRTLFLEREQPWYAQHRDLEAFPYCELALYTSESELRRRHTAAVRSAVAVIVGSYVAQGVAVGDWVLDTARGVRAFYDIDTPVTLAQLEEGNCSYLERRQIPEYDLILSFTGGPTLSRLRSQFGARRAVPLYCSVDTDMYRPLDASPDIDLGYMGTYSADRQTKLARLLLLPARRLPARRFMVAGAQYPATLRWPPNVRHEQHMPPARHREFYGSQRFTLNITRADMAAAGWSPSVRLFEAAACGVPIVSDSWPGLEEFFEPGEEILTAYTAEDMTDILEYCGDAERARLARAACERVRADHSGVRRAAELEDALRGAHVEAPRRARGGERGADAEIKP
ncbi:MAG: glycosyltransferase [Proteobacteria bacterium]|nr:MAG: glycosyltransferase [Pseudomonadota bacterium]